VSNYQLSPHALADLRAIIEGRAEYFGSESADELEQELLAAFSRIAVTPGLGHRRSDLTPKPYFFYAVQPYLIVYLRQVDPLPILGVLHAARDVRRLLKRRSA